jgi:tetratricopeptide (TPR) repeat protein
VLTGGKPYSEHNPALGTGESSYGLGWEIHIDNGDTIIGHSGYNRGIYVQLYINLSQQQVIVLFDNMEGADFLQKFLNAVRVLAGKAAQPVDIRLSAARYFGNALLKGDPEAALLLFNDLRLDSSRYHFTPQQMNQLGYDFLHTGFLAESLATFRINLLLYPNDFNRYDSYADALVAAGKKGDAILFYRKALALKPDAAGTRKKLEKLGGVPPSNQK